MCRSILGRFPLSYLKEFKSSHHDFRYDCMLCCGTLPAGTHPTASPSTRSVVFGKALRDLGGTNKHGMYGPALSRNQLCSRGGVSHVTCRHPWWNQRSMSLVQRIGLRRWRHQTILLTSSVCTFMLISVGMEVKGLTTGQQIASSSKVCDPGSIAILRKGVHIIG